MYVKDTIAAISTPMGEGGIGIVRISGDQSLIIAEKLFRKTRGGGFQSHRFYYGLICDPNSAVAIDEALAVYMQAPRSYTGENVVELQCHGGYLVVQKVLELVLRQGCRMAEPGEFTRRAFLNGRIDLVQAEAVIDVIRSKTEAALSLAQHQREGLLSAEIQDIKNKIVHALALVEAHIDFPEEDIDASSFAEVETLVLSACEALGKLLAGYREGKVLREGVTVLIAGKPNVGKSSLLNTLLREKRAIVTSVPGTTRDIIEEVVNIKGLPVRFLDTAGIRETSDEVERLGVDMALQKIPHADLILFMVDVSRPYDDEDQYIFDQLIGQRYMLLKNKCDLFSELELPFAVRSEHVVKISTLTGEGIDLLRDRIFTAFIQQGAIDSREYVAISHLRHRDILERAQNTLGVFLGNMQHGATLELLSIDLRETIQAIGEVTGETTPDDILDLIFSRFCIGK